MVKGQQAHIPTSGTNRKRRAAGDEQAMKEDSVRPGQVYRERVWTQSYGGRQRIEGVELHDLTRFSDEGGDFCELARCTARLGPRGGARLPAGADELLPDGAGSDQGLPPPRAPDDLWFVPPRFRPLVGLLDVREGSASHEVSMRLVLGAGRARLLWIPKGVAHGVANLSREAASIIYFTNVAFDPAHPDEHRLPHDLLGADFRTIRPG